MWNWFDPKGPEPGRWAVDHIEPLFDLFKDETFAPSLAVYLLLFAAVFMGLYAFHVFFIWWALRNRRRVVETTTSRSIADDLPKIKAAMVRGFLRKQNGLLHHAWIEFDETLIKPDHDESRDRVWNTVRPQEFFNPHEAGLHFRFYRALPNIFVGVGLLFTFAGLVSALYFATQGIDQSASVDETQAALQNLLHAATFKFYTSIAGLAASLAFVIALRIGSRILEGGFERLSAALESRLQFVTREGLAFKQVALAEKQHEELIRLNADIAVAIGKSVEDALNKTLPKHLGEALEPLSDRLQNVTGNLSDMNVDALSRMAESFQNQLTGAAQGQFNELATVLTDLKSSLDGMKERMDQSGSQLADNVRASTDDMRTAIGAMTTAVNEISDKMRNGIEENETAMQRQTDALNERLGRVAEQLAGRLEDIGGRIMASSNNAAEQFSGHVGAAAGEFEKAAEATAGRIRDAVNDISRGAEAAGEEAAESVKRSATELEMALRRAAEEFGRLETQIGNHRNAMQSVAESTSRSGTTIGDAADAIRRATSPLQAVASEIAEASRETRTSIESAVNAIQAAQSQVQETASTLERTAQSSGEAWHAYAQRFEGIDESLGNILGQMIEQVQEALSHIQRYVTELDNAMADSITHLAGGIETLGEIAESLEKANGRDGQGPAG